MSYVFSAGASAFSPTLRCDNSVSFVPVAGMHYRAHYEMHAEHCAIRDSTVGGDAGPETRVLEDVDAGCRDSLRG